MLINEMANLNNAIQNRYDKNYSNLLDGYEDADNNYSSKEQLQDIDLSLYKKLKKINIDELEMLESLGRGSFGEVRKAYWKKMVVAVKKAEHRTEVKALLNEIHHLARSSHDNIIHLFGVASTTESKYLVMEFADGGSLYHFLHTRPYPSYSIINTLSWLMQCARAVDYLHSYQPKAIIHRDLKSLNMLLKSGKRILKICDFGTACDQSSIMTANKGSVAWMAPEVMSGKHYNEKCDVYSYGLFIWEILTRKIPGAQFNLELRIMFQVVNNKWRPPLIKGCPNPIQHLMQRCWDEEFRSRPSMEEVLEVVTRLFRTISGRDEPASFVSCGDTCTESLNSNLNATNSEGQTSHDVSEFPTDSTSDYPANIHGSKKLELWPIESNSSSLMDFDDNCEGKARSRSNSNFGSSTQEDEFDAYEPIAIFKEEPAHVPRPVFRDRCPENISQNLLLPLNINIPDYQLPERNDLCLSVPKTSKIDVKISPRPSTVFPSNYPTVSYNHSNYLPLPGPNPAAKLPAQPSFPSGSPSRNGDSCHRSPIVDGNNCFGQRINADGSHYRNLPPTMRKREILRDPIRRRSAEISQMDGGQAYGHRRSSSYDSGALIGFEPLEMEINNMYPREQNQWSDNTHLPTEPVPRSAGYGEPVSKPVDRNHLKNIPSLPVKDYWPMVATPKPETSTSELGELWQYLDEELKPAKAIPSCPQSQNIYENHKEMARDLLVVQEKIFYGNQNKKELLDLLRKQEVNHKSSKHRYHNTITHLEQTNQTLRQRQHDLKRDLEQIQAKRRQQSQVTKLEPVYNHNEHMYHQPADVSTLSGQRQRPQGLAPYCKCHENIQPNPPPSARQGDRESHGGNTSNAQSQSHFSHCVYNNSYYRHQ